MKNIYPRENPTIDGVGTYLTFARVAMTDRSRKDVWRSSFRRWRLYWWGRWKAVRGITCTSLLPIPLTRDRACRNRLPHVNLRKNQHSKSNTLLVLWGSAVAVMAGLGNSPVISLLCRWLYWWKTALIDNPLHYYCGISSTGWTYNLEQAMRMDSFGCGYKPSWGHRVEFMLRYSWSRKRK